MGWKIVVGHGVMEDALPILVTAKYLFSDKLSRGKPEAVDFNDFADRTLKPPNKKKLVVKYKDSKGKNRIKGSGALKASEAYPRMCFG